jgi:hypothetical protein
VKCSKNEVCCWWTDNKMVEERVPSHMLRRISHSGCYTDILFVNDVLGTTIFPIWTDQLFVLNKIFILAAEKCRHPWWKFD